MNEISVIPRQIDVETNLNCVAERIRARIADATENIIAIGQDLIIARDALPHGAFLPWLEEQFSWSRSTAYNFITAAELAGKFPTVRNLQAKTVYLLAAKSTPATIVTEVISDLSEGKSVEHSELAARVRDERQKAWIQRRKQRRAEAIANKDKRAIKEAARESKAERERTAWETKRDAAINEIVELLNKDSLDFEAILAVEDGVKASGLIRMAFEIKAGREVSR